jgi:hypothetical protein
MLIVQIRILEFEKNSSAIEQISSKRTLMGINNYFGASANRASEKDRISTASNRNTPPTQLNTEAVKKE